MSPHIFHRHHHYTWEIGLRPNVCPKSHVCSRYIKMKYIEIIDQKPSILVPTGFRSRSRGTEASKCEGSNSLQNRMTPIQSKHLGHLLWLKNALDARPGQVGGQFKKWSIWMDQSKQHLLATLTNSESKQSVQDFSISRRVNYFVAERKAIFKDRWIHRLDRTGQDRTAIANNLVKSRHWIDVVQVGIWSNNPGFFRLLCQEFSLHTYINLCSDARMGNTRSWNLEWFSSANKSGTKKSSGTIEGMGWRGWCCQA